MIDPARLHHALTGAARRYAPALDLSIQRTAADLADALAIEGTLILISTLPADPSRDAAALYKTWADLHTRLITTLAGVLFPSYTRTAAFYADQAFPPIVVITGQPLPVIHMIGGYVTPFTAARRAAGRTASAVELRGLIDVVLDELEAGDLPRDEYRRLRDEAASIVQAILSSPIQPLTLTRPLAALFGETPSPDLPPAQSPRPAAPAPPASLPETPAPATAPAASAGSPPIFFHAGGKEVGRRAPVPELPPRQRPGG